eukprot:4140552-Lingulodinium_polyedra.AAC.1
METNKLFLEMEGGMSTACSSKGPAPVPLCDAAEEEKPGESSPPNKGRKQDSKSSSGAAAGSVALPAD